jgi:PAS domain S-box-containing protein
MIQGLGRWRPLALIVLIGVVLSLCGFFFELHLDRNRIQEILEFRAEWRAQDMRAKIVAATAPVKSVVTFMGSNETVDPEQFHRFVSHVDGIDPTSMIAWAPFITPANRSAFEREAERDGKGRFDIQEWRPDGSVVQASPRAAYLPIWLEEHGEAAAGPIIRGIDLMSEINRRVIIEQSIDSALPQATPPVQSLIVSQARPRYLMVWPVYAGDGTPAPGPERRARLRGFVVTGIDFLALLNGAIHGTPDSFETITVDVDGGVTPEGKWAAVSDPATGRFNAMPASKAELEEKGARFHTERQFDVLGRVWTLTFRLPPERAAALSSSVPWLWLMAGLLLTVLAAAYADRERLIRIRAEAMVEQRTGELSATIETLDREAAERERAEAAVLHNARLLAKTLDATPLAIVHLNAKRDVLVWNPGAEAIFGYSTVQLIGRPLPTLSDTERADLDAIFTQLMRGEEVRNKEVERHHKDGHPIRVSLSAEPIFEGLTFQGAVMVLEDLTQRHMLEAQLRQAQKMEALGQLTGGMAHDFNNLLLVILGNLSLLADGLPPDDEDSLINCTEARDAALRGAALIRSLLAFARRQPLRPEKIDVNALVSDQMVLLRRTLGDRVEIVTELADGLWPVMIDPAQLEAALVNLATNARDAMPKGGRLTITTRNRRLDRDYADQHADVVPGDYTLIEVNDTGIGMSQEVVDQIFEPFFTTKERGSGTGLGLSMVFGFVKQSGGHINVYSEVGVGTTFRLFLPRTREGEGLAVEALEDAVPSGKSEMVLVVEDNDAIRRLAVRQLGQLGYQSHAVANAADALDYLASGKKVDLLFTDVIMPGNADGFDLTAMVRERWPSLPVLLTSGFPNADGIRSLAEQGVALLSKPYQRDELARALRQALMGREK